MWSKQHKKSVEEVTAFQDILEKLRCSLCNDYLSCSPIKLTCDGKNICGRCLPSSNAASSYRNLILEELMRKLYFPCQFQKYGCEECLVFGQTNEHEGKCRYRILPCPLLTACTWTGLSSDLSDHYSRSHPHLTKENPEFEIKINHNKKDVFMAIVDEIPFFIKYSYNFTEDELHYGVSYIGEKILEAEVKIRLANSDDHDYSFTSKGGTCLPYDVNFSELPNLKTITLKQYLEILRNPECIVVTLKLYIKKHKGKAAVNYRALDHLRCSECRGYLVPPLYDSPNGIICVYCSTNTSESLLSSNEKLRLVMGLNFPCRWRECTQIELGSDLHKHEQNCKFRILKCRFCNDTFNLVTADDHLVKQHDYMWFHKEIVFTLKNLFNPVGDGLGGGYFQNQKQNDLYNVNPISIDDLVSDWYSQNQKENCLYTIKSNEIIYISVKLIRKRNVSMYNSQKQTGIVYFSITITCNTVLRDIPLTTIYFEHPHCKVRSTIFTIVRSMTIDSNQLPACFNSGDLTATLNTE